MQKSTLHTFFITLSVWRLKSQRKWGRTNIQNFLGYLLTPEDTKMIAYIGNSVIKIFLLSSKVDTLFCTHAPPTMAIFGSRCQLLVFRCLQTIPLSGKALPPIPGFCPFMSGLRFSVIGKVRLSRLSTLHCLPGYHLLFHFIVSLITTCSYFCAY